MAAKHAYRNKWIDSGYKSDMGSAIACLPPSNPDLIRVYHLTTAQYAINNLALSRLKVARFSDLNDPFELLALNFRENTYRNVIREFKDKYNDHTGLLCFSGDWTEPVMWSHYAMRHTGICLGFNIPKTSLQHVRYESERVLAELGHDPNPSRLNKEIQDLLLCTKSIGWQYEDEYRQFIPLSSTTKEGRLHFLPFSPELELAEVILGPLCEHSVENVRRLTEACNPKAITFKSRLAFQYFKIVPDERSIP